MSVDGSPDGLSVENPDVSGVPTLAEGMEKCAICERQMIEGEDLHHGQYQGKWVNACDDCKPRLNTQCYFCQNGLYLGKALVRLDDGEIVMTCLPCLNLQKKLRCVTCNGAFYDQPILSMVGDDDRLSRAICRDCADELGDRV